MLVRPFCVLAFLGLASFVHADSADPTRWTVDDVVLIGSSRDFQIAPDGKSAVWVQTEIDPEEGSYSNLWLVRFTTNKKVQLTRGKHKLSRPRWSPDGRYLAFLSDRTDPEAKKPSSSEGGEKESVVRLWLLDSAGGEAWALTHGERDVQTFDWAGSEALVFAAQEDPDARERGLEEGKDTTEVVEDDRHNPPVRLFRVELESGKVVRISKNRDGIELLSVSPDGRFALVVHSQSLRFTYDNRTKPIVRLHDLNQGTAVPVLAPQIVPSALLWSIDGRGCYVVYERSSQMQFNMAGIPRVQWFDPLTKVAQEIDLQWENGLALQSGNGSVPGLVPVRDGFIALLANGARPRLARYTRQGNSWNRTVIEGVQPGNVFGFASAVDGSRFLFAASTASTPTRWYQAPLTGTRLGKSEPLTDVPARLVTKTKAKTSVIRWKGAENEDVEGILYFPHDYQQGKKYPLVVMIHGGPAGADYDSWDETWATAPNLYCQRGAFVLKPNYHGSSDYGPRWLESNTRGKYCDLETVDIDRGVDHLIAQGLVDREKLGILGWSNGGILTSLITTQTTRYKAAAPGAGTIEYISDWANCEFGDAFDRFYLGKSALEDPRFYQSKSCFFSLDRVRTPTLIFFGTKDRVVPTQQGWMHYRALQQLGKTEVKFVLFPEEEHSLKQVAHQRRKLTEELAWFDRYLFGTAKESPLALKPDSPLATLLARETAEKVEGKLGSLAKQILVPEVARFQGITLGRFEVTQAQFAQFDTKFVVTPGSENLPMTATFEQALGYCRWLSEKTGHTYRLPNLEESEKIHNDDKSDGENTLDHWMGNAVNPDDAGRILAELDRLPGKPTLLRPVGFKGRGEPAIFDLGGNVAEWVQREDGKGVLRGGSADRPADPRSQIEAGAGYRGFRVVMPSQVP